MQRLAKQVVTVRLLLKVTTVFFNSLEKTEASSSCKEREVRKALALATTDLRGGIAESNVKHIFTRVSVEVCKWCDSSISHANGKDVPHSTNYDHPDYVKILEHL